MITHSSKSQPSIHHLGSLTRLAAGELEVRIAPTDPLERVQDAFRELERRHIRGKIVLRPSPPVQRLHTKAGQIIPF